MDIRSRLYAIGSYIVFGLHQIMILMNVSAIPMLVYYQPWYIWMPIITMLVSPLISGTYCLFNQLEDHYRNQAGLPLKYYKGA